MVDKRRWLRISLRTFLSIFTCVAIAFGLIAHRAEQRRATFAAIRQAGGIFEGGVRQSMWLDNIFGPALFGDFNKIDLRKANVDNELLSHIGVLRELRRLDLSYAHIDDEGLKQIAHLPLWELRLDGTSVTDASAITLSKMRKLAFLQLNDTALSNDFLEHLESLPKLENLGLRRTRVTSEGMNFLPRHPNLKELDLYSTEINDSGVQNLVNCQQLTDLRVEMTNVTDHVFFYLDMLPNLTHVDVSANRSITSEAVSKFRSAHPTCTVTWDVRDAGDGLRVE